MAAATFETFAAPVQIHSAHRVRLRVVDFGGSRGRGVVADQRIEPGELIERAPVVIVPPEQRDVVDRTNIGNYIFVWEHNTTGEDVYKQDGRVAVVLGFASLVNHSDQPNCRFIRHIEALALDVIALRTISVGEELSFDYGMTLWFTPD